MEMAIARWEKREPAFKIANFKEWVVHEGVTKFFIHKMHCIIVRTKNSHKAQRMGLE